MVVFHCNFTPSQVAVNYETAFTVFRVSKDGGSGVNLGDDSTGMFVVSSSATACCEYPHGMYVDTPPAPGTYTYVFAARTKKSDRLMMAEHWIGADGWISAVLVGSSGAAAEITEVPKLIEDKETTINKLVEAALGKAEKEMSEAERANRE